VLSFGLNSVAYAQIAFGRLEIHYLHAGQLSEITIPHFLPAGGEKVIEQF
jgi:hypothetical protein